MPMLLRLFRLTFFVILFLLSTAKLNFILPEIAHAESKKAHGESKKAEKPQKKEAKHKKEEKKHAKPEKEKTSSKEESNLNEEKEEVIEVLEKEEIKGEENPDPKKLEAEAADVGKIDAVLIIDSSRSMQKTDPEKLREQAAKLFFRLLSEGDRLAIISFDKDAKVVLPLTGINLETITTFDRAISAIQYEGGFTDIQAPIAAAYKLLSEQGRKDVFKSVLLLSDGKMDPYPERGTAEELIKQTEKIDLPRYKSSNIKLYTVALSEQADRELLNGFAKLTDGANLYAPDSSLIHKKFGEVFLTIKKPQMITLKGGTFEIDSAVKEVTFFISKNDALATLTILDPAGKVIAPDDFVPKIKWYTDDKVDLITVYEPLLGVWQIRSNEKIEGFARLLSDAKLHVKFPAGNFKFGESVAVYAKLVNQQEDIIKDDLANITFYTYKIINVNSGEVPFNGMLNDKGQEGDRVAGDGIYSSVIKFDQEGEFQALFGVTTPTFTRQQQFPMTVSKESIGIKMLYENEGEENKENPEETNFLKEEVPHTDLEGLDHLEQGNAIKEEEFKTGEHSEHLEHTEHAVSEEKPPILPQTLKSIQVNLNHDLAKLLSPKVKLILKKINLEKPISKEVKKHDKKKTEKTKDIFVITLKPLKNDSLIYEYPVEKLEAGEYKVYARLTAKDGKGKEITAISSTIKIDLDEKDNFLPHQIEELKLITGVSSIYLALIWMAVIVLLIRSKKKNSPTFTEITKEGIISENLKQQIEIFKSKVSPSKRKYTEKDLEIFSEVADVFNVEKTATNEDSDSEKSPQTEISTTDPQASEEVKENETPTEKTAAAEKETKAETTEQGH